MDYFDFTQEISRWATSEQGDQEATKEEDELNKLFHKSPQFGMAGRLYNKNIYRSPKQSRNGCRESQSKEIKTNQRIRSSVNRLSNPSKKQLVSSALVGSNNNNNNNDNKNDNELVKQQTDENNGSIGNLHEKTIEPLLSKYENYVPALLQAYFPNDPTMAKDSDFLNIRKLNARNKNDESASPRSKKDKKKGKECKGLSFTQMRETVSKQLNNETDKYNDADNSDLFDINLISDTEKHKRAMAKIEQGSKKLKNQKRRKHYRMNHHCIKMHDNTPFHNNISNSNDTTNSTTTTTAAASTTDYKNDSSSKKRKHDDSIQESTQSTRDRKKLFIQHNIKQIHVIQEKYLKGNNSEESSIGNIKHHRSVPRQKQREQQHDDFGGQSRKILLARHRYNQRLKPLLPSNIDKENGNDNDKKEVLLLKEKDRKAMNDVTNLLSGIKQQSLSNIVSPITSTNNNKIGVNNENNNVNRKLKPSYTFHKSTFAHIQRFYKSPTAASAATTNDNGTDKDKGKEKEKERDIDGDNRSKFLKNMKGNFCSNSTQNIKQIAGNNNSNNNNNNNKMWQSRSCDSIMRKNGELTFLQPTKAASIKRRSKYMNNNHDSSSNSSMKVAANGDSNNNNNNNGGSSQSMIDLLLNENILPHYMLGTRTRLGISDVSEQYKTENEMSAKETIKSLQQLLNEQHNEIDQMEKLKEKRAVWRQRAQKKMEDPHGSNYVGNVKLNLSPTSTKAKIVSKTPKLELRAANKSASPSIISIDSSIFNVN